MSADGELPGMWEESDLSGGWADTDGMTARGRLIRSVYQKLSQNQMEKLVDAFAHELAERQRAASVVGRCGVACGDEYCESCNTHKLIDLIDPEVSK